jgi:hypothetical protein
MQQQNRIVFRLPGFQVRNLKQPRADFFQFQCDFPFA